MAVSIVVHTGYQITLFCCSLNTDQHLKELSDMGIQSVSMFAPLPTDWNPWENDTHHSTLSTWNWGVSNRRCSVPTCWMNWYISCTSICMWIFFWNREHLAPDILVCAAVKRCPRLRGLNSRSVFLTVMEAGKSEIWVLAWSGSGKSSLPALQMATCLLAVSSRGGERVTPPSFSYIPLKEFLFHDVIKTYSLPKGPIPENHHIEG